MDYSLFKELYAFLNNRELPPNEIQRRKIRRMAPNYTLRDNRLFYTGPSKEYMRLVVMSEEEKTSVLMECHSDPTTGKHYGLRSTRNRVIAGYYWPTINHDVGEWLRCCPRCRHFIPVKTVAPASEPTKIKEPWEVITMYLIGPVPQTHLGNQYVLTMIDFFTKFVVVEPLKSKTAAEVSAVLTSKLHTFGLVRKIITDQRQEFVNELNDIIFCMLNIKQAVFSESQPNGQDERTNQSIKRALRKYISQNHDYWDIHLAAVVYGMNTTKQHPTRHSPYFLFFHRHPRRPVVINACPLGDDFEIADPEEDINTRVAEATFLHEKVFHNVEKAQDTQGTSFGAQKRKQAAAVKMAKSKKRKRTGSCPSLRLSTESPERSEFPAGSSASVRSDNSKYEPPNFRREEKQRSEFPAGSSASVRSDNSKYEPPNFRREENDIQQISCSACGQIPQNLVLFKCGHLSCQPCATSGACPKCGKKPKILTGDQSLQEPKKKLRKAMQEKFDLTSEGIEDLKRPLKSIYTTLYITTRDTEEPSGEHDYSSLKFVLNRKLSGDFSVELNALFKQFPHKEKPNRVVLTNGIAGIGKSFAVQKFILDWAEEKFEQDVDFVFFLAFRELHMCKGEKSLLQVLTDFHPSLQLNDLKSLEETRTVVILDGFDESRLQLDFENSRTITSVSERTSVENLLVNLIKGNILPDANIWITSRPAAANQIPAKYVNVVTEIRGFNDTQKAEYFRKRLSPDSSLADRVISHIQSSQTLDMMCQIPIFCWISAILFQDVFRGNEDAETPQTLTEMMAHFLFVQTKRQSRKYEKKIGTNKEKLLESHRDFLLKLGKLAFVQLQESKLVFYEEDLKECGIDVEVASVYSGFCNTVLRKEEIFFQKKIFFFVHLTIQEFFAALYVYECLATNTTGDLCSFLDLKEEHSTLDLLKKTVDKVMEKKNGHLEFFLRFLLGLTVESNKRILNGLLTPLDPKQETDKKILTYLRSIRRKTLSPDSCINIFQTMVEMRDYKVKDEIQEYLRLSGHSETELTPLHCSALAFMLLVSKNELEELNLKSYKTSEEGRRRLIPAVRSSRRAVLKGCKVTPEWVEHLAFGLKSPFSPLQVLDLSTNDLKDSGVEKLCVGLSNSCCRLQTLRLSGCMVTKDGCSYLVSALQSNSSHLTDLDLSYNHPGESGRRILWDLKENPHYALTRLNLDHGGEPRMKPGFKKYAFEFTLDSNTAHRNLLLSDGNTKVTWVKDEQPYPPHPERFDQRLQVISEQGVQQSCFFEVEKEEPFSVGLTYKSIGRKGDSNDCTLGLNEKSWVMSCYKSGCSVRHGSETFHVTSLCPRSSRVGVFLDWEAGELSFYRVSSDNLTFLHTFQEHFSDALYAAVELAPQSSAQFCRIT